MYNIYKYSSLFLIKHSMFYPFKWYREGVAWSNTRPM